MDKIIDPVVQKDTVIDRLADICDAYNETTKKLFALGSELALLQKKAKEALDETELKDRKYLLALQEVMYYRCRCDCDFLTEDEIDFYLEKHAEELIEGEKDNG